MKKQSVRQGVWYIGYIRGRQNRRRQRGGFLPIDAFAAPKLGSLGGVVIKKIFGGKRRRRRRYV